MRPDAVLVVDRRAEERVRRGHPWIFRSDLVRGSEVPPAALVRVVGQRGRPLGTALYSSTSEIALRLLSRSDALPDDWLRQRLTAALAWRKRVAADAPAQRLVHGEGDGLPGLVVDRYGSVLVIQTLCQAMERLKPELLALLAELLAPVGILERNDPRVRTLEGLPQSVSVLHGSVPEQVRVDVGGVLLEVDPWKGQKTGLFLDQRENYAAARRYACGRVLDGFSYDGGFALSVAPVADEVLAVEISEEACARIARNAQLNAVSNIRPVNRNVFDLLHELDDAHERFDTVILDPPAFAKSRSALERALGGYKQINLRALKILKPGGCLITCSCSYHLHEDAFEDLLGAAAADAGVTVSLVEKRRQARDHPVLLAMPESYYLKCFVVRRLA